MWSSGSRSLGSSKTTPEVGAARRSHLHPHPISDSRFSIAGSVRRSKARCRRNSRVATGLIVQTARWLAETFSLTEVDGPGCRGEEAGSREVRFGTSTPPTRCRQRAAGRCRPATSRAPGS